MAGVKGRSGRKLDTIWSDAIRKAINDEDRLTGQKKINKLAETLVSQALDGDIQAIKEIGDRLEGKPKQQTEIMGEDGGPVTMTITWKQP